MPLTIETITGESRPLTDNGPLWCPGNRGPGRNRAWRIVQASVFGTLMDSPINTNSPFSGLFIAGVNARQELITDVNDTSQNISLGGVPLFTRGVPLDMQCSNVQTAFFATGGNVGIGGNGQPRLTFTCILEAKLPVLIYEGQTLLGVYVSNPGTPVPGPGANSRCKLSFTVIEGTPDEIAKL